MARLDDLCDSLDYAATHTMEGHAKLAPGVLKLLGDVVKEARGIQKSMDKAVDAAVEERLKSVTAEMVEPPAMTQVTIEHFLCKCGKPAKEHFCSHASSGGMFDAGPSLELEEEPNQAQKKLLGASAIRADVAELKRDMLMSKQAFRELGDALENLSTTKELENVREEIQKERVRIDDLKRTSGCGCGARG